MPIKTKIKAGVFVGVTLSAGLGDKRATPNAKAKAE